MISFTSILDDFHIPYHTTGNKTRSGWVNIKCPYCGKDPYMGYCLIYRYVTCWNCGYHSLAETIHNLTRIPLSECISLTKELPKDISLYTPHKGELKEPSCQTRIRSQFATYLKNRKIHKNKIDLWGLKGLLPTSKSSTGIRLGWRIYLPIYLRGEIVSWTTRKIVNSEPRYISAKAEESLVPIENCIYGLDFVQNTAIICEGPFDAIAVGIGGVAVMGLGISSSQMATLSSIPHRVIVFDSETNAQIRAKKLANDLSLFPGTTQIVTLETGNDPASAKKEEIDYLRKQFL